MRISIFKAESERTHYTLITGKRYLLLTMVVTLFTGCSQYSLKGDEPRAALPVQTQSTYDQERVHQEQILLALEHKLEQGDVSGAQGMIAKINPDKLTSAQQKHFWQSTVSSLQDKPSSALLLALIAQEPLLTTHKNRQENSDQTWVVLTALSQIQVDSLPLGAETYTLQGWLALRRIWSDGLNSPNRISPYVSLWQARWPLHPAAKTLPLPLVNFSNARSASVNKIALMLPMRGPAARFGHAIEQGLEAQKKMTSSLTGQTSQVKLYDTSGKPLVELLAQAEKDGVTLVVGPLLKKNVREILNSRTSVNVLALNLPEDPVPRGNLCYFALSPEDEARNAAQHMSGQGKHFPLLLLPRSELGGRVASAFLDEWEKQGGDAVLVQRFGALTELKKRVNSGEGISLTGTPLRGNSQKPLNSGRERRVDSVYIIATPAEIAYLRAMIVIRNGNKSGAMLYASSRSISDRNGADYRLDMEGLQFSDIPMLSDNNQQMKQRAFAATRNDYFLTRLYAMGADAWILASNYSRLRQMPMFKVNGNTGELSATPDCMIKRTLPWFRFQNGRVISVS